MQYFLCFIFPPLAVASTKRPGALLLNCILTVCFWFPGVIHAFLVVGDYKAQQRTDAIVSAIKSTQNSGYAVPPKLNSKYSQNGGTIFIVIVVIAVIAFLVASYETTYGQ